MRNRQLAVNPCSTRYFHIWYLNLIANHFCWMHFRNTPEKNRISPTYCYSKLISNRPFCKDSKSYTFRKQWCVFRYRIKSVTGVNEFHLQVAYITHLRLQVTAKFYHALLWIPPWSGKWIFHRPSDVLKRCPHVARNSRPVTVTVMTSVIEFATHCSQRIGWT